jgi:Lon protease-like protein
MKAGNASYHSVDDVPAIVPVLPLAGVLLLPGGQLPLNIFEPRYLAMVEDALSGNRIVGVIQPRLGEAAGKAEPALCDMGCLGRLSAFQESGDGRYLVNFSGICRFRVRREVDGEKGYRRCEIAPFGADLAGIDDGSDVDRGALLETFRKYLDANAMEADWDSVKRASNETLVTTLCMMSPYGPAEKQALLEAATLKSRAETLVAITEIALAREAGGKPGALQ